MTLPESSPPIHNLPPLELEKAEIIFKCSSRQFSLYYMFCVSVIGLSFHTLFNSTPCILEFLKNVYFEVTVFNKEFIKNNESLSY